MPSNRYTLADWREAVGDSQPGGGNEFSLESGSATLVIQVPWRKARSFLRFVLGWSYPDRGAPYQLHRENPVYHPIFSWLRASSVTMSGLAPAAVEGVGSKVAGAFSGSVPVGAYQLFIATVRFTDHPWTFLDDDEVPTETGVIFPEDEAQRNTYFDPVPSVEIISAEGLNNIAFANGPSAGTAIPAPFGTLMSKMTKTLNWMNVPHEYISGSDTLQFTPTKILSVVGRVNSDTFLGHPPGTLLLQAPAFTRFRFPEMTNTGIYGYFGWNIKFPMQFFDPDRGFDISTLTIRAGNSDGTITFNAGHHGTYSTDGLVTIKWGASSQRTGMTVSAVVGNTIVVTGGTGDNFPIAGTLLAVYDDRYRGHQLVPRRSDLKWYGARREQGDKLFPEATFSTIFEHVGAP